MTNWIRRALGRRREPGVRPDELAILERILEGDDPRFQQVIRQLADAQEDAREVVREYPQPSHFRVGPRSTTDDLSFPLEVERLESAWLRGVDRFTGRELEFRVVLGRHGFLRGLEGRTVDGGEWPRTWSVEIPANGSTEGPLLTLPSASEAAALQQVARRRLADWLGVGIPKRVEMWPPATDAALAGRELSHGGRFPSQYRTFLGITDGLRISGAKLLGHQEAYPLDNVHLPALVVAWDADNVEDFVVVLSLDGVDETVYRIDVRDQDARPRHLAENLKDYLRTLVPE